MASEIVCCTCGSSDQDSFSKRQKKKGSEARCKSCVEESQNALKRKRDDDDDDSNSDNDDEDQLQPSTKARRTTRSMKIHDDDDDSRTSSQMDNKNEPGGVSVEDLKRQILGRSIKTGDDDQEEDKPKEDITCKQDLRSELQCAICHELLLDPTSLICGHCYCKACLDWWIAKTPKCPTCRRRVGNDDDQHQNDDHDDPPQHQSFGINTALRSCIEFLFPTELEARRAQARKAMTGENGGRHNRGYQVEQAIRNESFQVIYRDVKARSSVILDASDQQMRLALSIESLEWKAKDDGDADDTLRISLCLLHMEEDEVEEIGGAPLLLKEEGDEHLICNSSRFQTTHIEGYNKGGEGGDEERLMDRKALSSPLISFDISYGSYIFRHSESGAELELRVREGIEPMNDEAADDSEAEHAQDEEDDDFVVDQDVCHICKDGGDLLICDGGEEHGGCSRSFHVACINRTRIPEGDWICQDCSRDIPGLNDVGVEGHEFGGDGDDDERLDDNESTSEAQFSPMAPTGNNRHHESSGSEMDENAQFSPGPDDRNDGDDDEDDDEEESPQIIQRKKRRIQIFDDDDDDE